ncbi:MAG TPA: hypothetical protein VEZ24_17205 [Microvirga sp.]|nr:hypothetical protein [Microvirga sp.]
MYPNSRFMLNLQHDRTHDGPGLALHALPMMQVKWDRLTAVDVMGIRTPSELIEKVEESYSLSHEQATRDVEFWTLDKQL